MNSKNRYPREFLPALDDHGRALQRIARTFASKRERIDTRKRLIGTQIDRSNLDNKTRQLRIFRIQGTGENGAQVTLEIHSHPVCVRTKSRRLDWRQIDADRRIEWSRNLSRGCARWRATRNKR